MDEGWCVRIGDINRFTLGKLDLDIFLDKDSSLSELYGLIGVPTFYFVDQDGMIRFVDHSMPRNYEDLFLKKSK